MGRIHGERREKGQHLVHEILVEPAAHLGVQVLRFEDEYAGLAQILLQSGPDVLLARLEAPDHLGDLAKLLGGGAAVDARRLVPAPQQSEKAGDPDNEEFIQVLAGDGEEPYPLQEGMGDILGLVENALVEAKPGELPVEEPYRACRVEVEERPRTGRRIQEIRREGAEGRAGLLFGCRLAHAILLCAAL